MKTQRLLNKTIRIDILIIISLLFLLKGIVYAESDSNCIKYNMAKNESRIEISFYTLDKMLAECKGNPYETLKRINKDLNDKQKESEDLKGFLFFYRVIDNKADNCNIYYQFKNRTYRKMRSFPRDEHYDCTGLVNEIFYTFLCARKKYLAKIMKYFRTEYPGKPEVIPMIDPTLTEISMVIGRHPEVKRVFATRGVKFIEIPVPVTTYIFDETIWERSGVEDVKEAMSMASDEEKYNVGMTAAGAFNPRIALSETIGARSKRLIYLPVPFAIPKNVVEKAKMCEIQKGNTLEKIAKDHYGDKNFWGIIYQINRDKIKNPNKLKPGIKIRVPKKENLLLPPNYVFVPFKQVYIEK